jgi:hypothetical protein
MEGNYNNVSKLSILGRFSLPVDRLGPFCYHLIEIDITGGIHGQDADTID